MSKQSSNNLKVGHEFFGQMIINQYTFMLHYAICDNNTNLESKVKVG
jgi:hypothetical protein